MKLTVDPKRLAEAAGWAARAVPARPTMPELSGILLEADGDCLVISAFDYDVAVRARISADVAEPGRVLVSGRVLAEATKNLPTAQFAELVLSGSEVLLKSGSAEYALITLVVEGYPTLPISPPALGKVDAAQFRTALGQVLPAADVDSAQPFLTALQIIAGEGGLQLTATDTARIAHRDLTWQPVLELAEMTMLVPAKAMQELARGLGSGMVEVCGDANQAGFLCEGRSVVLRLLDAGFPNWKRAAARLTAPVKADVPVAELAAAVARVKVMADKTTPISLTFEDDLILVRLVGTGGRGSEVVACGLEGGPLALEFQPYVLADGLAAVQGERATLGMSAPGKGALLAGEDPSFQYIAMPLRAS